MGDEDAGLLENNDLIWHRGTPADGVDALFHGPSSETWMMQGKAQWAWVLRRDAGGNATMSWIRGARRGPSTESFQPEGVLDVTGGVSMSGLGNYQYFHGLYIEEGGFRKAVYLHLREPPLFANKARL